jgi:nucleolar protein 56
MKAFLVTTIIGCFGVDESKNIVVFKPFPKDPKKIAEKIVLAEKEMIEEEKQVFDELKSRGFEEIIFNFKKPNVKAELGNYAEEFVKNNLRKLAVEKKFVKDEAEFNKLLVSINVELTKEKIKKTFQRDKLIIQANNALEELDKIINILVERLREFYSFHFPELDKEISNHEKFAKIVEKFGSRDRIEEPKLRELARASLGVDFTAEDIKVSQDLASEILNLFKLREKIKSYLEKNLAEIAPNFTELATPQIAAKLMARAGSLEKLAKMASSSLQLIGAEKALFRYLKGKGKGPRFGILAIHPLVQKAPEELKGKVARILAAKLSMAAKMDFYSKKYKAKELKEDLEKRIKEILGSK